jgi:GT2 family glycosyltransferase
VSGAGSDRDVVLPPLQAVVVNWNGRVHLDDCLGSLLASGYGPLQIVMVDNGSTDGSVAHVRERYPAVEVIALPENRRWAGGNNVAIRRLREQGDRSRYLLLLNNDTIVMPGSLQRLMREVVATPAAWAATPRICYAAEPARVWYDGGLVGARTGWVRHAGIRQPAARLSDRSRFVDYGTGCALLLSPRAMHEIGELDESYYFYGEDCDYCLRLRAASGRVLHVPAAIILHKVSASYGATSARKAYLRSRSHIKLLRAHWPARRRPVLMVCQLMYYTALAGWHLWGGRWAAAFAAWRGALDELRRTPLELLADA